MKITDPNFKIYTDLTIRIGKHTFVEIKKKRSVLERILNYFGFYDEDEINQWKQLGRL
jgi:hypothetical protein